MTAELPVLTRRHLLTTCAGLVASVSVAGAWRAWIALSAQTPATRFHELLFETVKSFDLQPDVGRAYLSSTKHGALEQDLQSLSDSVRQQLGLTPEILIERATLLEMLRAEVERDFQTGKLCYLDGWYLSLTECRLAAIKHLLAPAKEPGNSAPLRQGQATAQPLELPAVVDWGPRSTMKGAPFNQQPDGSSAFWFKVKGQTDVPCVVLLDDLQLQTTQTEKMITADLSQELAKEVVKKVGAHKVYLADDRNSKRHIGDFVVRE